MATNSPRSLQIYDPVLSNLARSYRPTGFIADRLLADIPVSKLSGQYPVFTKAFWFQNDVDNRVADRSPAREIDFEWSTETYLAEEYALKVGISDLERQQADTSLRLEQNKTEFLSLRMTLAHEIRTANTLRKSGAAGATTDAALNLGATPAINWDQDTAVIEQDLRTGVNAIYDATGQVPNVMVVPFKVAYAMATQEDIRQLLRYDASGRPRDFIELGNRVLPNVIHGMQVVIPQGAQVDSSNEGGTSSVSEIWADHVRLLMVNPGAGWGIPSVAYKLNHTPKRVTRWRQTDPDVDYIREMERYDIKIVAPDCGYELTALLS